MADGLVNSKKYWDDRFSTNWEENEGREQTVFFGKLALSIIPEWIVTDISENRLSIADVGCAEGDATQLLSLKFTESYVCGIDFSDKALAKAMHYYPGVNFEKGNIYSLSNKFDVIFSSNTLEHFSDPVDIIRSLTKNVNKYMIFLLPFQEYIRIDEHFFTFDFGSFPLKINDFSIVYYKTVDCNSRYWVGKQIFVVYAREDLANHPDVSLESFNSDLLHSIKALENEQSALRQNLVNQEAFANHLQETLKDKSDEISELNKQIDNLQAQLAVSNHDNKLLSQRILKTEYKINEIYNSDFWKVALKYYKIRDRKPFIYFYKSAKVLRNSGVKGFIKKLYIKLFVKNKSLHALEHTKQLKKILKKHKNKTIIIFLELVDWNIPLFQRPQHIALRLAKENFLYFYCTPNNFDHVSGFKEIENGCYVTNRLDLLKDFPRKKIIHLYSTDMNPTNTLLEESLKKGDLIFYEYIDEIHEDLSGSIPDYVREKHNEIIQDENCVVVASANKLYDEVKSLRSKNFQLVTNGVDIQHFGRTFSYEEAPDTIKRLLDKNEPIIGYYGAFASWFDYDLVMHLAKQRPNYQILLIGWKYDHSMDLTEIEKFDNVTVTGPIDYKNLPEYAHWFDVSMIPFVLNDITESTSPIKLFEYMALGKPIVTTDMPECRKYKSVYIGKDPDDFIKLIDQSLTLKDDSAYKQILESEALENTWDSKAKSIADLLRQNL